MNNNGGVLVGQQVKQPLPNVSLWGTAAGRIFCSTLHALFVTVRANFLMLFRFPFSHRMWEYMVRTRVPSCFLVTRLLPTDGLRDRVPSPASRLVGPGVPDRDEDSGLGVRDMGGGGMWKA